MQDKNILEYWNEPKKTELEQMSYDELIRYEKVLIERKKFRSCPSLNLEINYKLERIGYIKQERGIKCF